MKLLIAFVAPNRTGKGTCVGMLTRHMGTVSADHQSTRGFLEESLKLWHLPSSRRSQIDMFHCVEDKFGTGTLVNAMKHRIMESSADIVIYDCIRTWADYYLIRSFKGTNLVIAMHASPERRCTYAQQGADKPGETLVTPQKLLEGDQAETSRHIPEIAKRADFHINNDQPLESGHLEAQIARLADGIRSRLASQLQMTL